jgi:hypothetical protein
MSGVAAPVTSPVAAPVAPSAPVRRVRHQVRDKIAVMAFSAATSVGLAGLLLLLARIGK